MKKKGFLLGIFILDIVLLGTAIYLEIQQDKTAPVISFPEEELIWSEAVSEEKLLEGVTALDNVDGDVTDSLLIEKVFETVDGKVVVMYAALDHSNNVTKTSRVLTAVKKADSDTYR